MTSKKAYVRDGFMRIEEKTTLEKSSGSCTLNTYIFKVVVCSTTMERYVMEKQEERRSREKGN